MPQYRHLSLAVVLVMAALLVIPAATMAHHKGKVHQNPHFAMVILGDGTDETLEGGDKRDKILGRGGDDELFGYGMADLLRGGTGDDTLWGGDGRDKLHGGPDADILNGEAGNDVMRGGKGADILDGGDGRDLVAGGPGNDKFYVQDGEVDKVRCGRGDDEVVEADPEDRLGKGCEKTPFTP
jgi:Ca2+-binding RTX toxin-like protein